MKLILTGHYAGKTVVLNGHKFVDGELELTGDISKLGNLINYFRSYSAFLSGSDELANAQARDKENANGSGSDMGEGRTDTGGASADVTGSEEESEWEGHDGADSGSGGHGAEGDGVPEGRESRDPQVLKIIDAIKGLDPEVDEFWTAGGLPAVKAIEQSSGIIGVTRKEIEAAMPEYTRDKARENFI